MDEQCKTEINSTCDAHHGGEAPTNGDKRRSSRAFEAGGEPKVSPKKCPGRAVTAVSVSICFTFNHQHMVIFCIFKNGI